MWLLKQMDGLCATRALENHIHHLSSDEEQAPNDFTLINATTYMLILLAHFHCHVVYQKGMFSVY